MPSPYDPYARIRPVRPASTPQERTFTAAMWTLALSLLFAPLALVSLILGAQLATKADRRGVWVMIASVLVLAIGLALIASVA